MRVKVTGYLIIDDEFADDEHGSGVTSAGWDDVQESEISDLEDLDVRRA